MTKIKNINGTSDNECKCGTWLAHWKKFSGQVAPIYCPVVNCLDKDLVGAHVQKANSNDNNWYIVPLCRKHNGSSSKDEFEISDNIKFVSANRQETCEKPNPWKSL